MSMRRRGLGCLVRASVPNARCPRAPHIPPRLEHPLPPSQNVRNFIIRDEYVSAVEAHSKEVLENLFNVTKMADTDYVETLAKGCYQARESALEAARRAMRPTARHYSEWLKETGIGFDDLVNRRVIRCYYGQNVITSRAIHACQPGTCCALMAAPIHPPPAMMPRTMPA